MDLGKLLNKNEIDAFSYDEDTEEHINFGTVKDQKLLNDDLPLNYNFFHKLIIPPEAMWKSIFDVWILFLVAYSCSTNILFISFPIQKSEIFDMISWIVEIFFYFDFIFSWFQSYTDIE